MKTFKTIVLSIVFAIISALAITAIFMKNVLVETAKGIVAGTKQGIDECRSTVKTAMSKQKAAA